MKGSLAVVCAGVFVAACVRTAQAPTAAERAVGTPPASAGIAVASNEPVDAALNARIRAEGMQNSKVLETAVMLSDLHGSRLAGSRGYTTAARWARDRLASWGLSNAALESWGMRGHGWEIQRHSVEMVSPHYLRVTALPKTWSPGTRGTVAGTPRLISVRADSDFVRYRGQLRGAIVLNGNIGAPRNRFEPPARRYTDAQLDSMSRITDPGSPATYWEDAEPFTRSLERRNRIENFFREEGVAAVLEPSPNYHALTATSHVSYNTDRRSAVPGFIVAREHYDRIVRLVRAGRPVRLELSLTTTFTPPDSGYNIIAEIPGADPQLGAEVVMLGGHFDTWHAATGATDNAAGCAVVMEAMRILRTVAPRPRRTIRIALWDGEEQEDYFGSMGYVKKHFGDPEPMTLKPAHRGVSAYFNVDHGTGRIRGFYVQGNTAAAPILRAMLAPWRDMGAATVSIENRGSTDHMPFASVGLPAFNSIQDPIDYDPVTHHTNRDIASYLLEDDLKQAAIVVASVVYHVANRNELMPRTALPAARSRAR